MIMAIDISQDRGEFREQIRRFIQEALERNDVIPVPLDAGLPAMVALLSQVNCEGCLAPCCKPGSNGRKSLRHHDVLELGENEFQRLHHHWDSRKVARRPMFVEVPLPCPFLRDHRCTIYETRPLVCKAYPLDSGWCNGRPIMALQSSCPEGRRIAENVYMAFYDLQRSVIEIGPETIEAVMSKGS